MVIEQGNSYCKIVTATEEELVKAAQLLSYYDSDKEKKIRFLQRSYQKALMRRQMRKAHFLAGEIAKIGDVVTCMLSKDNTFPTGLLFKVKDIAQIVDKRIKPEPYNLFRWNNTPPKMRYYQEECVRIASEKARGTFELAVGCHAKGQGILMYDGAIRKVEDIAVGDKLMGPDSKERVVHTLYSGKDKMVQIIPTKGEKFIVNENHILSLVKTKRYKQEYKRKFKDDRQRVHNPIINIKVKDFLLLPCYLKNDLKLYRCAVDFKAKQQLIPSYILGLWLGDGNSNEAALTTMDQEIKTEWLEFLKSFGPMMTYSQTPTGNAFTYFSRWKGQTYNPARLLLKKLNLLKNKHVPHEYLTSSREDRLELLAGLLDTDGSLHHNGFDIIQKNKLLAEQIVFLARSLGLAAYIKECKKSCQTGTVGTYWRVSISGDCSVIPCKLKRKQAKPRKQVKNVLFTGFKVRELSEDSYFGFGVDKDNLYLMQDFTVTHNSGKTLLAANIIKNTGVNTLFIVPSSALSQQTYEVFTEYFGKKNVTQLTSAMVKSKKKLAPIVISTVQTLASLVKQGIVEHVTNHIESLMIDEAHHGAANSYMKLLPFLDNVYYRFNFSGTYTRNDNKFMELWGVCDERLYGYNSTQATKDGFLTPVEFIIKPLNGAPGSDYQDEYKLNYGGKVFHDAIVETVKEIPNDKQILILIDRKDMVGQQIKDWLDVAGIDNVYISGDNDKKEITKAIEGFNNKEIRILIGSTVIGEGVDIRSTEVLIMARGGKSEISITQAIGRAVRLYEGKEKAYVIDYEFQGTQWLKKHTKLRKETYANEFAATF